MIYTRDNILNSWVIVEKTATDIQIGKDGYVLVSELPKKDSEKKVEQPASGWMTSLVKGAAIGAAVIGVAYFSYRAGFYRGADGVIDEMKKYAEQQARSQGGPSSEESINIDPIGNHSITTMGSRVSQTLVAGRETLNRGVKHLFSNPEMVINSGVGSEGPDAFTQQMLANPGISLNWDDFRKHFVDAAVANDPVMNNDVTEAASQVAEAVSDAAKAPIRNLAAAASDSYYTVRNEAITWVGSLTLGVSTVLLSAAKLARAVRGPI